jgi:hypothetical protein
MEKRSIFADRHDFVREFDVLAGQRVGIEEGRRRHLDRKLHRDFILRPFCCG